MGPSVHAGRGASAGQAPCGFHTQRPVCCGCSPPSCPGSLRAGELSAPHPAGALASLEGVAYFLLLEPSGATKTLEVETSDSTPKCTDTCRHAHRPAELRSQTQQAPRARVAEPGKAEQVSHWAGHWLLSAWTGLCSQGDPCCGTPLPPLRTGWTLGGPLGTRWSPSRNTSKACRSEPQASHCAHGHLRASQDTGSPPIQ